jgi:hypothetical protein
MHRCPEEAIEGGNIRRKPEYVKVRQTSEIKIAAAKVRYYLGRPGKEEKSG